MKKFNLVFLSMLMITLMFALTGCGGEAKETLSVYNWGDYMDDSLISEFEAKYNIKVDYQTFATNEDMYYKIQQDPSSFDIIFPSDYMIEKMAKEGLLAEIDYNNIPNYANVGENFKGLDYDPDNKYSVPYLWGTLGIIYNSKLVNGTIDSWDVLWDPQYKGEILMYDSVRDTVGVSLKRLGYSINSTNLDELEKAKAELIKQKPLVRGYVGDNIKDMLISEEAAIGVGYSGEVMYMMQNNPNLRYVIPKEGTNLWFDAMAIPAGAKNKKNAELFINFMLEAESGKKNVEYMGYCTPNTKTLELIGKEFYAESNTYPDDETIKNSEVFIDVADFLKEYNRIWTEIKVQ